MKVRKKRNDRFEAFCDSWLNLSKRIGDSKELKQYIDDTNFDVIISGSDQVFNPNVDDFEELFFFPFSSRAIKVAYAASTGNATKEDLSPYRNYIADFKFISIREEKDLTKFEAELRDRISIVCDPVMLMTGEEWSSLINRRKNARYLVCYFLHKEYFRTEYRYAKQIAKTLGLKIKYINARFSKESLKRNTIFTAGPYDFVQLLANAEYICTDSFHGTLFALLLGKPFSCFDTKENTTDSRRKNLLESVGASAAFHYIEDANAITNGLDYTDINEKIKKIQNDSKLFLEKIIGQ